MSKWKQVSDELCYDRDTGAITWRKDRVRAKAGDIATSRNGRGYLIVKLVVDGKRTSIAAHRVAYILMGEELPVQVDHINNDRMDNRWCNLRPVNNRQNAMNRGMSGHNTSGVKGVSWDNQKAKWVAVAIKGKTRLRAFFSCLEEATQQVKQFRKELHGDFTNNG